MVAVEMSQPSLRVDCCRVELVVDAEQVVK